MRSSLSLAAILFASLSCVSAQDFQSPYFEIQPLGEGIFAALAKNGSYAISNAGIINLGDATLVFDAFMTPEAARDLKRAAQKLTGHPVKYVVNSHFHNDHIGGNEVFSDAAIISTSRNRDLMEEFGPEEIEYFKRVAPDRLAALHEKDTSVMSAHELAEYIMMTGYFEALIATSDSLKLTLPDVLFDERMTIAGTSRQVELLSYGGGHTESDLFLYIPDERIAFLGDLLFIQNQPWLGDGNPDDWAIYLDSIAQLDLNIVVPGHGPVGTSSDFSTLKSYFQTVHDLAVAYHDAGNLPEEDLTLKSPPPFDNWFLSNFYRPNVINEYERLFKSKE